MRRASERREIRDLTLKEVIGSSGPLGGRAVNRTSPIGACVCILYKVLCVCVYVLFCSSNVGLCAGTFKCVSLCLAVCLGGSWNAAILSSLRARNHSRPLPPFNYPPPPIPHHIFNVAFQSLFYCHIFRVVTVEQ